MANPTFNSSAVGISTGSVLSVTVPFTVPSGISNGVLIAMVNNSNGGNVVSADWNGTSMTQVSGLSSPQFFGNAFYILTPEPGSFDVNLNWNIFSHDIAVTVVLVENADAPDNATVNAGFTDRIAKDIFTTLNVARNGTMLLEWFMGDVNQHISTTSFPSQVAITNGTTNSQSWRYQASYLLNSAPGTAAMDVSLDAGGSNAGIYQVSVLTVPPVATSYSLTTSDSVTLSDSFTPPAAIDLSINAFEATTIFDGPGTLFDLVGVNEVVNITAFIPPIPTILVSAFDSTIMDDLPFYYENETEVLDSATITIIPPPPPPDPTIWTNQLRNTIQP